jgi:hypothetical protein
METVSKYESTRRHNPEQQHRHLRLGRLHLIVIEIFLLRFILQVSHTNATLIIVSIIMKKADLNKFAHVHLSVMNWE